MTERPLILLPPSEGKEEGGGGRVTPDRFGRRFETERQMVRDALGLALHRCTAIELSKLMKVRGPLLERALISSRAIVAHEERTLPAWQRYNGVVWDHLQPATLPPRDRRNIIIPSALYGATTAEDAVADYRLTMNISLGLLGNLAKFWRPALTELLMSARGHPPIINLLPAEHTGAFDLSQIPAIVTVQFRRHDGQGAVGHEAKAVKGTFARYLIDAGIGEAMGFRFERWKIQRSPSGFVLSAPA